MTEENEPRTTDERIAKALDRIADCLEGLTFGDEQLHVWVKHVSDAGEAKDGSTLGYLKVVARDDP
jgi:hypothetical protein